MRVLSVLTVLSALSALSATSGAQTVVTVNPSTNSFDEIQGHINSVGLTTPLTIVLAPGSHQSDGDPTEISLNGHKNLVITSTNPTDINVVQTTILEGLVSSVPVATNGFVGTGSENGTTIIEGITIQNMTENGVKLTNGSRARVRWSQIWNNGKAGVRCENGSTSTIKLVDFRGNASSGVRCVTSSAPNIDRCVFIGNSANRGGGVASKSGSAPTITDCVFSQNAAVTYGGAVSAYGADAVIERCEFTENASVDGGGAVAGEYASLVIRASLLETNASKRGGGVYLCSTDACISLSSISGNSANFHGGGIWSGANFPLTGEPLPYLPTDNNYSAIPCNDQSLVYVSACFVQDNTATNQGGGLYVIGGTFGLHDSLVTGNQSGTAGGGLRARDTDVSIADCTFSGNADATKGGAVHATSGSAGTVIAVNSIFWGDSAPVNPELSGPINVSFCDVQGGVLPGPGNISANPLFNAAFCPTPGSPAINAGSNILVPADICDLDGDLNLGEPLPLDVYGNPRILPMPIGTVDMGACEVQ